MPLYNKEAEIERAVRSVLRQTVSDFELIVINDGSTDKGAEFVRSFQDPRMKIIDQANAGVSAARNRGIEEAKADLIAFLDADDEWEKDFLEAILRLRTNYPTCKVYATRYFFRRPGITKEPTIRRLPHGFREGVLSDYFAIAAVSDPPLWTSATAVEKTAILSIGGFPTGIIAGEDLLTWARLAVRFDIAYSTAPKAHCWEPISLSDRPGRTPQSPDRVGEQLAQILPDISDTQAKGVRAYISLWHRMRGVIYLQLGDRKNARLELKRASAYARNPKIYLLLLIWALPFHPAGNLISAWRYFRRAF
jgi:glycosyltransferase involved in cell wall biosynthesis